MNRQTGRRHHLTAHFTYGIANKLKIECLFKRVILQWSISNHDFFAQHTCAQEKKYRPIVNTGKGD